MLTEKEAEEKLRGMAQEFQDLMKQRQYGKAKARYDAILLDVDNGPEGLTRRKNGTA